MRIAFCDSPRHVGGPCRDGRPGRRTDPEQLRRAPFLARSPLFAGLPRRLLLWRLATPFFDSRLPCYTPLDAAAVLLFLVIKVLDDTIPPALYHRPERSPPSGAVARFGGGRQPRARRARHDHRRARGHGAGGDGPPPPRAPPCAGATGALSHAPPRVWSSDGAGTSPFRGWEPVPRIVPGVIGGARHRLHTGARATPPLFSNPLGGDP